MTSLSSSSSSPSPSSSSSSSLDSVPGITNGSDIMGVTDLDFTTLNATANETASTTVRGFGPRADLVPDAWDDVLWVITYVLIPSISIIGLAGNSLSLVVISRDGLRKSSNVLLIALAVSDTAMLTGVVHRMIYKRFASPLLCFGRTANFVFFYLHIIFNLILYNMGVMCSCNIAMFITFERLCAVSFPLKFYLIITPLRTLATVLLAMAFYLVYILLYVATIELRGEFLIRGRMCMIIAPNDFHYSSIEARAIMSKIVNELTGTVALAVLVLGSIVISIKVRLASLRRAKMVAQGDPEKAKKTLSQTRTTKTLLAVCITFVILFGINYIYVWVEDYVLKSNMEIILFADQVQTMLNTINGSCNFFIYVVNNNKFKEQLVALFKGKGNQQGRRGTTKSDNTTKMP